MLIAYCTVHRSPFISCIKRTRWSVCISFFSLLFFDGKDGMGGDVVGGDGRERREAWKIKLFVVFLWLWVGGLGGWAVVGIVVCCFNFFLIKMKRRMGRGGRCKGGVLWRTEKSYIFFKKYPCVCVFFPLICLVVFFF